MNYSIAIHVFIKMLNKLAKSFFPQWDFFYGTEEVLFKTKLNLCDFLLIKTFWNK